MSLTKLKLLGLVPSLYRQVNLPLLTCSPTRLHSWHLRYHVLSRAAPLEWSSGLSLYTPIRGASVSPNPVTQVWQGTDHTIYFYFVHLENKVSIWWYHLRIVQK